VRATVDLRKSMDGTYGVVVPARLEHLPEIGLRSRLPRIPTADEEADKETEPRS
jgi:hypothetical protein